MPGTIFDVPDRLAVMTYNLKNGGNVLRWRRRRDRLAEVIYGERPILVGTQEGFASQLRDLRNRLPGYDYVGEGRFADFSGERVAILYDTGQVRVLDSGTFWLADAFETPGSKVDGEDFPRIATWIRCAVAGYERELVMVNTHLTNRDIGLVVQTDALLAGTDRVAGRDQDVILTGDFNQVRHSPTWQTVVDAGFADSVDFATTIEGPSFTYADWRVWTDKDVAAVTRDRRIDWIMYRPVNDHPLPDGVHLRVINTHTKPNPPSDHFPVVLTNERVRGNG